jgi:plasmid stability protein
MASITLKDIPEDLHAQLKEEAAAHGRSLSKELLLRLKVSVMKYGHRDVSDLLADAARVRRRFKGSLEPAMLDRWKRQGRP